MTVWLELFTGEERYRVGDPWRRCSSDQPHNDAHQPLCPLYSVGLAASPVSILHRPTFNTNNTLRHQQSRRLSEPPGPSHLDFIFSSHRRRASDEPAHGHGAHHGRRLGRPRHPRAAQEVRPIRPEVPREPSRPDGRRGKTPKRYPSIAIVCRHVTLEWPPGTCQVLTTQSRPFLPTGPLAHRQAGMRHSVEDSP